MIQIRIREDALQDLGDEWVFCEAQEYGLADYFCTRRRASIASLRWYGGIHRIEYQHDRRLLNRLYPWVVYCRMKERCAVRLVSEDDPAYFRANQAATLPLTARLSAQPLSQSTIMFMFFPPSKKPTPSEYAVLVWFVCIVFIVMGVVAVVAGLRAPEDKHDVAVALETGGAWCLGIGIFIAAVYWLYRRLRDY